MGRKGFVTGTVLLMMALTLLVVPLQWVMAFIMAAAFHEFCHYGAVRLCGGDVGTLWVGSCGARMEVEGLTIGKELICALAGPLGSLSLLYLARWIPRTAICAGAHGLYNLLPVYPLDGGRALQCLTELVLPERVGNIVCRVAQWGCLTGLLFLGFYGAFGLGLGFAPILGSVMVIVRVSNGKIPCKLK